MCGQTVGSAPIAIEPSTLIAVKSSIIVVIAPSVSVVAESSVTVATTSSASVAAKSSATVAGEVSAYEDPHISVVREIRVAVSMGPRTYAEFMKLVELNADIPKDPDFTLVMYNEDGKEIGFVHNVTQWDPSALLNHEKCITLYKFLQLPVL